MKRIYINNGETLIITTKSFIIRSNYSKIEGAHMAYVELKQLDEILGFGSGKDTKTAIQNAIHQIRKIKIALNDLLR